MLAIQQYKAEPPRPLRNESKGSENKNLLWFKYMLVLRKIGSAM